MAVATIPADLIEEGRRLREISPAEVASLVSSITDVGLLNPITVYPRKVIRAGVSVEGFGLVAGAHRLAAIRDLGLVEIDATIVTLTELERQIAECDENLCGSVLSKAERAMFTARRKEAYEALHPETKHGGDRASGQVVQPNFAEDQAEKTGVDARTVRRDAERGAKISERALSMLKGTKLDTGTYLDKLKEVDADDQIKVVRDDLEAARKPKPVKLADVPLNDFEAKEKQVAALMSAWNKASPEARDEFLTRIDNPIMVRSFA